MINNVVLVSGVLQSDSVVHIHVSVLFPVRLLQNVEQSSLDYTVGPYWLFVLNIVVCISIPPPIFPLWYPYVCFLSL